MAEPAHSSMFEKAIQVSQIDSHTYSAYLDALWCIGFVPHGGYTIAVLYRLATVHCQPRSDGEGLWRFPTEPIAFQLSFLRRTSAGRAVLKVQDMTAGARVGVIQATLLQAPDLADGKPDTGIKGTKEQLEVKMIAHITVSPPKYEKSTPVYGPWKIHPPPAPGARTGTSVDITRLVQEGKDGAWVKYPEQPLIHSAARQLQVYEPRLPTSASLEDQASRIIDQWARFTPGGKVARWSNESMLFLIDMFPGGFDKLGAMESTRMMVADGLTEGEATTKKLWFATVSMNIDLKTRIPPEGVEWLYARVVSKMVRGSRADIDVTVLDSQGVLIGIGTQISLVVDSSRNLKGRNRREKL